MGWRHIGISGLAMLLLATLAAAAAWWLPLEKNDGVFGRFDYAQLLALIAAVCVLASVLLLVVTRPQRRRKVGFRVVAVWLGLLVPLGIWEAGAYQLPAEQVKNPWYLDAEAHEDGLPYRRPADIQWSGRSPGQCTFGYDPSAPKVEFFTDKNGFRNRKDPDRADIVFVGDSFTEGVSVNSDETFVDIVKQKTGEEVANLGRSGYSPGPELVVLRHYAMPLKPGIVVWQMCEGNDLEDSVTYDAWLKSGRRRFYEEGERNRETSADAWKRRSPTFQLFTALRPWPFEGDFHLSNGNTVPMRFYRPLQPVYHCPQNHPGWNVIVDAVRTGQSLLKEKGIHLVVVLAPLKLRVLEPSVTLDESTRRDLLSRWNVSPDQTWSVYLARLCRELEIPFVDPTEALRKASSEGVLTYLPNDTHLSPEGHRIMAEEITRVCNAIRKK